MVCKEHEMSSGEQSVWIGIEGDCHVAWLCFRVKRLCTIDVQWIDWNCLIKRESVVLDYVTENWPVTESEL